jgi:hypothetical protein
MILKRIVIKITANTIIKINIRVEFRDSARPLFFIRIKYFVVI